MASSAAREKRSHSNIRGQLGEVTMAVMALPWRQLFEATCAIRRIMPRAWGASLFLSSSVKASVKQQTDAPISLPIS